MPTLRTERLVLRPMVVADIEWYARFAGDADVMRFIGRAGPLTREQA